MPVASVSDWLNWNPVWHGIFREVAGTTATIARSVTKQRTPCSAHVHRVRERLRACPRRDGGSPCMAQSCLCSLTCSGLPQLFSIRPAVAGCLGTWNELVDLQWVMGPPRSNPTPPNTPLQQPNSPNQAPLSQTLISTLVHYTTEYCSHREGAIAIDLTF